MTAQHLLNLHAPQFLHDADTLLALNYPQSKITRKPVLVEGRIHVGYRYRVSRGFLRFEEATAFGLVSAP
jgi:hypothetical protein